jgi:hypothetical protein
MTYSRTIILDGIFIETTFEYDPPCRTSEINDPETFNLIGWEAFDITEDEIIDHFGSMNSFLNELQNECIRLL